MAKPKAEVETVTITRYVGYKGARFRDPLDAEASLRNGKAREERRERVAALAKQGKQLVQIAKVLGVSPPIAWRDLRIWEEENGVHVPRAERSKNARAAAGRKSWETRLRDEAAREAYRKAHS